MNEERDQGGSSKTDSGSGTEYALRSGSSFQGLDELG